MGDRCQTANQTLSLIPADDDDANVAK